MPKKKMGMLTSASENATEWLNVTRRSNAEEFQEALLLELAELRVSSKVGFGKPGSAIHSPYSRTFFLPLVLSSLMK
jgi:hypothetical protein